jgi:hypothetical protein
MILEERQNSIIAVRIVEKSDVLVDFVVLPRGGLVNFVAFAQVGHQNPAIALFFFALWHQWQKP